MWISRSLTVTSGTPLCAGTGDGIGAFESQMANAIIVQPKAGATSSKVTVMMGVDGGSATPRVPSAANDASFELAKAADANTPGEKLVLVEEYHGIDLNRVWIDVATTNTVVLVSYDLRV